MLDSTVPGIRFDENGECQFCKVYDLMDKEYPLNEQTEIRLKQLVDKIKSTGKKQKYDCILGISGGTDSTYTLYKAVELGLRPLAVHFDNGWNSKLAVQNIKNACNKLNVDLNTYVVNWPEFRDLQISFLKASTPDAEIPTDVAIHATLIKTAAKENVKYILNGHSFRTEFVMPIGWTYMDGKYISSVQKKFGTQKLDSFPNFKIKDVLYFNWFKGIKVIPFLNYFEYNKKEAQNELKDKLGWEDYGGHHHESIYTKFFQSYYLPVKFGIDKRKTALSAQILSGQTSREEALKVLETPYEYDESIVQYTLKKLGLSNSEFEELMKKDLKSFKDYPTYFRFIEKMKFAVLMAVKINIIPKLLYYKFFDNK